jgi:decaprenyl-phosphate phosphoribosyltransferase
MRDYISLARVDHWVKNVFVIPGVVVALTVGATYEWSSLSIRLLVGLLSIGLITSSNYVLNELMDAPFDLSHPTKRFRPVPSGRIRRPLAYAEWIVLLVLGIALGLWISIPFVWTMVVLWIMAVLYNVPPARTKDVPYLDVLSESVNNPLRMLAGWYIARSAAAPPISLLVSYWMIGCYFMAIKRYAEYHEINEPKRSAAYRRSFAWYNERRLLVSIMFYAAFAMLMFGVFIMRYRIELILTFPLIALVMSAYLSLAFKPDSAVQRPEGLYREPALMVSVCLCAAAMLILLFVDVPQLQQIFAPLPFGMHPER